MSYDFDSVGDYISLGNGSAINPTTNITVSLWHYTATADLGGDQWFIARDDNSLGRSFAMGLRGNSTNSQESYLQVNGNATVQGVAIALDQWAFMGFRGTTSDWSLFTDSTESTTTNAHSLQAATGDTTIGRRTYSGFLGEAHAHMAEVAIWDEILSDDEMIALYSGVTPDQISPGNLVTYLPLVGNTVDRIGNASITVNGDAAAVSEHPPIIRRGRGSF